MKKTTPKGNWENENCKCTLSTETLEEGLSRINQAEGTYTNGVATAVFSLNRQENGEYELRGSLTIRSVRTGHVLRACPKDRQTEKPLRADLRLKSGGEVEIKNKVVEAFESLYQAYADVIYKDATGTRSDDLRLSLVVRLFGREFLMRETHAREETTLRRLREMGRLAARLDRYPLGKIPLSALVALKKEQGAAADDGLQLLWRFLHYLQAIHQYFGENMFDKYYQRYPKRTPKPLEEVVAAANRAKSLPDSTYRALAAEISRASATDAKTTGLLLIHHGGLSAVEACKLTWGQVTFDAIDDGSCQLALRKDDNAGATHDYTHPVFPFAARELRRRYDHLRRDGASLDSRKVLAGLMPKVLTAHCRTRLHHLGVSHRELAEETGKGQTGGGVKLLLKDYEYRLVYHCGIRSEGELNYMRLRSLSTDVTADNYRSFSSPSGQKRLLLALRRDTRLVPTPPKCAPEIAKGDNRTCVTVTPQNPGRTTAVTLRLKLQKGQTVTVWSEAGLRGTVSVV